MFWSFRSTSGRHQSFCADLGVGLQEENPAAWLPWRLADHNEVDSSPIGMSRAPLFQSEPGDCHQPGEVRS